MCVGMKVIAGDHFMDELKVTPRTEIFRNITPTQQVKFVHLLRQKVTNNLKADKVSCVIFEICRATCLSSLD
jgi:hypothetical protein